ncbi:HD domain-containing protein [Euroglyphus maynei]|uniref:HD domain-containing protein n=1 Tax=Euroglyphus maynei TaxID=6958 RepID=A0A1Y3BPQ7_EURMA|nr:HD domain-containing protein [Euroglyphus maynei]
MSQRSVSSIIEPPTKIDDGINASFENIIAEYKSSQEFEKFANDNFSMDEENCNHSEVMECNNVSDVDTAISDRMIEFLCLTGRLKTLPRRGWILNNRGIKNPEPIAGHMYRMAIMSMLFDEDDDDDSMMDSKSNNKLDIGKMIKLSLIHDMAECIVGDITPMDGIDADEKHRNELVAMEKLGKICKFM